MSISHRTNNLVLDPRIEVKIVPDKRSEKPLYTIRTQIIGDAEFMAFHCKWPLWCHNSSHSELSLDHHFSLS